MIYIKTKKKFKCKKYPEIYEKTKQAWVRKKSKNKPEVARFKKNQTILSSTECVATLQNFSPIISESYKQNKLSKIILWPLG